MALSRTAMRRALGALALVLTGACSTVYTSPGVSDGSVFGNSGSDLKIDVVAMTYESAAAANLTPYIPARLPLGMQADAAARIIVPDVVLPIAGSPPPPPSRPGTRPGFIPDRLPPFIAPQPYRIGIADVLLLAVNNVAATVEQLPGLIAAQSKRQGFVVQDDGAIAIPDVGRIRVAGLTIQDAESAVFQALVNAGVDPSFSIEIAEFNSQRVSVGGQVKDPALVPLTLKPLLLNEAINSAGGLVVPDPKVARIQLFRNGETYQMGVERFLADPALSQIVLQDGDSIYVLSEFDEERARSFFDEQVIYRQQLRADVELRNRAMADAVTAATARSTLEFRRLDLERENFEARLKTGAVKRDYAYVTGEVRKTSRFELPFENKAVLADALFDEGGISIKEGDYGEIYVLRRSSNPEEANGVTAYHLDATNAANLALASMFELHAGDVIFVAEQPITAWNRTISQALPNLFISAANIASNF